jgi:hypothetical protein
VTEAGLVAGGPLRPITLVIALRDIEKRARRTCRVGPAMEATGVAHGAY